MSQNDTKESFDSTNIFDEFSQDQNIKDQLKAVEEKRKKDGYYYLSLTSGFLKLINIVWFFMLLGLWGYIYIQENNTLYDKPFLDPFCSLLLNSGSYEEESCSSVSAAYTMYTTKQKEQNTIYYNQIIPLIPDVYSLSNFLFSREVLFLLDKTENRLKPLKVLEEFDTLKNTFEPVNKSKIQCKDILIQNDGRVEITCDAYSSHLDRKIIWVSADTVGLDFVSWTSISIASSFINYLEKKAEAFIVVEKPKTFTSESVLDIWAYTQKTSFTLILQLRSTNTWLLK